jgi:hypothetical protein
MSRTDDHIDDSHAPLIEHLAELRSRLIWSADGLHHRHGDLFHRLEPDLQLPDPADLPRSAKTGRTGCGLILIRLQEGFFVAIQISLLGGLHPAFPYISYQMWRFVAPGLYRSEKGAFLPFLIASPVHVLSRGIVRLLRRHPAGLRLLPRLPAGRRRSIGPDPGRGASPMPASSSRARCRNTCRSSSPSACASSCRCC